MGVCIYGYFTTGSSAPTRTRQRGPRRPVIVKAPPVPAPSNPPKPAT